MFSHARRSVAITGALVATAGLAAVTTATAISATAAKSPASLVPAKIKAKGTLVVASDASYAPMEFFASDGKTVIGADADLAVALGKQLGLKIKVVNASFDGIIPALKSGKFDLGMSSFTDTRARQKIVDFVTYFTAGTSFFVKSSGGPNITNLASLCGHTVAVEKGTTEETDATAQGKKCGSKKVTVLSFPDQNGANLALHSGRAQVGMADSPVAAYQVKQSKGQFKLSGRSYGNAPYGIAIPKNNGMAKAILAAVQALDKNGTYATILKKWGIQAGSLTTPKINGATS
jgi:polar amino acid transport system substrate-binding protein